MKVLNYEEKADFYSKENQKLLEEINFLKNDICFLLNFCIQKGFDMSDLFGHGHKSFKEMTKEELIKINNEISQRQKQKVSEFPADAVRQPNYEEMEKIAQEQVLKATGNNDMVGFKGELMTKLDCKLSEFILKE